MPFQEEVAGFLEAAESLQIKGLSTGDQDNQQQEQQLHPPPLPSSSSRQKTKRPQSSSTACEPPKRPKRTTQGRDSPIVKHFSSIKNSCLITFATLPYVVKIKNYS
jgi:hypothetical protein